MNPLYVFVLPILVALILILGLLGPRIAAWLGKGAETPIDRDD